MLEFKQVQSENDIEIFFETIYSVALWAREKDPTIWSDYHLSREVFFSEYRPDELYILYVDGIPAATSVITDHDEHIWNKTGLDTKALYIHKIAIKREFAKTGLLERIFEYANEMAIKRGKTLLRMDCASTRDKVLQRYAKNRFTIVREEAIYDTDICHAVFLERIVE